MFKRTVRIERLAGGDYSFGCGGRHHGNGTSDCPRELHHHHDDFCEIPSDLELRIAGIDPTMFRVRSRE